MSIKNLAKDPKPHYVLVPLMAQGHTIPMVDLAQLLADRGAQVSFITTPVNATHIKPVLHNNRLIHVIELAFPCKEFGLPQGCESIDMISSADHYKLFFQAAVSLAEPLELYIRHATPSITCIISDYCNFFTADVAWSLNIPRVIFHTTSCLLTYVTHILRERNSLDGVGEFDTIVVPDLPKEIEINRAQAWGWFSETGWEDFRAKAIEAEASALGMVMNTCYELESEIIERYEKSIEKKVWPIGPLCLYDNDVIGSKADRGRKSSVDEARLLKWLDSKEPNSVVYLSFGSLVRTKTAQLIEIGSGLEDSNVPFVWVIKEIERTVEFENWMSEGFKERTKERGIVITGWAPQVAILSHGSVGGFATHCGWNSVLEAVSVGVPMLTWPHFADQFLNEKLIVEVIEMGVAVGVEKPYHYLMENGVAVRSEAITKAVLRLMDKSEEGDGRRTRAAEYGHKALKAMKEGGSSSNNLTLFMESVSQPTI